ncbi:MAG: PTS sugar transporter subunit IIA [Brevinema sp.]
MLKASHIFINMPLKNKQELFHFIATTATETGIAPSKKIIIEGLKKREAQSPTLLTYNIAFPHTRNHDISSLTIYLITLEKPIKYHGQNTAQTIFCILSPDNQEEEYLRLMSKCACITLSKQLLRLIHDFPKNKNKELAHHINQFLKSQYN